MDDPALDRDRHRHALSGLRRLNWISGVTTAMNQLLKGMIADLPSDRRIGVIDIASGSGDVPIELIRKANRRGEKVDLTTVDISDVAIDVQLSAAKAAGVEITALQSDVLAAPPTGHWDIAMCSLFLHHLSPRQVVALLAAMSHLADRLLICDLQRSRFNLTCVNATAHLVTRSDVVHHDADASVRAAFTVDELQAFGDEALGQGAAKVWSVFPCRMMLMT